MILRAAAAVLRRDDVQTYLASHVVDALRTTLIHNQAPFFSFSFSIPFLMFALLFSLCLLVVYGITQLRGHISVSSTVLLPPLPITVRALHFYREKISALSSVVDSHRIGLTHARSSQQSRSFFISSREKQLKANLLLFYLAEMTAVSKVLC